MLKTVEREKEKKEERLTGLRLKNIKTNYYRTVEEAEITQTKIPQASSLKPKALKL